MNEYVCYSCEKQFLGSEVTLQNGKWLCSDCAKDYTVGISKPMETLKMKITLKDLLEEEGVEAGWVTEEGSLAYISCQKCHSLHLIGVLIVHEGKIKVWCRHCVEESH